jgi:hypothetical protein
MADKLGLFSVFVGDLYWLASENHQEMICASTPRLIYISQLKSFQLNLFVKR